MEILIIIPSFYPAQIYGGPVFTSFYTCNELFKIGVKFKVVTTNANGCSKLKVDQNKFIYKYGYPVKYFNETIIGKLSLDLLFGIRKDIKKANIIHIQGLFSVPTPVSLILAKTFKKKVLLTPHGSLGHWSINQKIFIKKLWLWIFIKPYAKFITWHATSTQEKRDIEKNFPGAKVEMIPNGIYLEEFLKFETFSREDYIYKFTGLKKVVSHIVISVGRIQKVKGFDILIKSFKLVLKEFPDAYLLIAGEDEGELGNLNKIVFENNLIQRITFTGMISGREKINFFANADVFVLPSHSENFGLVYAEALAAGTPIIASINTPWQEVEESGCGRWIPNTVHETANAIIDILNRDPELLRKNALKYIQKFEWKNIALSFKKLYESYDVI